MEYQQSIDALRRSFDKLAPAYDKETDTLAHQVNEYVSKQNIFEVLSKERVSRILDAGGGTGKWAIPLVEMGYHVTLIDISPISLDVARQKVQDRKLRIDILEANAEQTPFMSNSFDFILSEGPLSYTSNPVKLKTEMSRILIPNGLIWIDFYNSLGWAIENNDIRFKIETALAEERLIRMPDWDYPARTFTINRVSDICKRANLDVQKVFGNHVLLNSLPLDHIHSTKYDQTELEKLRTIELKLSQDPYCVGTSKTCQLLARKMDIDSDIGAR